MAKSSIKQVCPSVNRCGKFRERLLPKSLKESSMPNWTAFSLALSTNLVNFSSFRKQKKVLISVITASTAVTKSISSL